MDLNYVYWTIVVGISLIVLCRKTLWVYACGGLVCVALGVFFSAYKTEAVSSNYQRLKTEWGGASRPPSETLM